MKKDYQLQNISSIAKEIITKAQYKTLLFYGKMGVGKTTLIKEICKQLGIKDVTSSPTFSLVNEYHGNTGEIVYHFDFYRLNSESEAYDIGIEEYFNSGNWCLIEWPENIENLLPLESSIVKIIELSDGKRSIQLN